MNHQGNEDQFCLGWSVFDFSQFFSFLVPLNQQRSSPWELLEIAIRKLSTTISQSILFNLQLSTNPDLSFFSAELFLRLEMKTQIFSCLISALHHGPL